MFIFQNVQKPVNNLTDFGNVLATHPLFPQAWAQKLCFYANSQACDTTDPEFQRVVGVFVSSGYQWNTLVRELLASPLTTHAARTKDNSEVIAVSRRDHLCSALNFRLGLPDICALDVTSRVSKTGTIPEIVAGLPSDGYGRGSTTPVLPNQPSLFFRAGMENICEVIAGMVIDVKTPIPNQKMWSSAQPDQAIADFAQIVMGLVPSDPRYTGAVKILSDHYIAAHAKMGITPTDAMKSTFTLACLAPSAVSIGL